MQPLRDCRALVVDITHGGKVLCEELIKRGCEVHAPSNVLKAFRLSENYEPEYAVFGISLDGTGGQRHRSSYN